VTDQNQVQESPRAEVQIALVGGQNIPIYIGVLERQPTTIHLFCTQQSQANAEILKKMFSRAECRIQHIDHGKILNIKKKIIDIIKMIDGPVEINLTGGTKMMALAAYEAARQTNSRAFYVDGRRDLLTWVPEGNDEELQCSLSTEDYFKLQGHEDPKSGQDIKSYDEIVWAQLREARKLYYNPKMIKLRSKFIKDFRGEYRDRIDIIVSDNLSCRWNKGLFKLKLADNEYLFEGKEIFEMLMSGAYLEYEISEKIQEKAGQYTDAQHSYRVGFNHSQSSSLEKNEIDMLVNLGRRLVFIECKAGRVLAKDVDKISNVRRKYGGEYALSILVCSASGISKEREEQCRDTAITVLKYQIDYKTRLINQSDLRKLPELLLKLKKFEL